MPAGVTSNAVANQALQMVGDNIPSVQGQSPIFDNSTAGRALQFLYPNVVRTVGREFGWDFARNLFTLVLTGNLAPMGFAHEYIYPPMSVEVWQVQPAAAAIDPNNPLPVNWDVGNVLVNGVQTKVIWTSQQNAVAAINNQPSESTWDPGFQEAVVRLLASELSMALFGRPDSAESYLQSGAAFETIAEARPD